MGTIYRKTVTRPLPTGCKIITRKGKQFAQWTNRKGKLKSAELTESGDRIRTQSGTYIAKYRDGEDFVCEVSTGCRDKTAAMAVLADLEQQAELVKSKIITSAQAKVADFAGTLLEEHIDAYISYLKQRKANADRVKTTDTRLKESATACGWRYLRDLSSDKLESWLNEQVDLGRSAAVYNGYAEVWVAFGFWCTGKRMAGKKSHYNGQKRLLVNPFDGMRRLDAKADRRRKARALNADELDRLLKAARCRPLLDAITIRTGENAGQPVAKVSAERRVELEHLGNERALIYKTAILTGLRRSELMTLAVGDLSFGDVPFVKLNASNEKNRQGSTLALRSDLAAELKEWTKGKQPTDRVFSVPTGLLRIMNRDLIAAGIPKKDADGYVVHVHALRHSFGTHLSLAGIAPRVAQAAMRHSDIKLTMGTYTDARLLDTASAIESLTVLRTVAPTVAPDSAAKGQIQSFPDKPRGFQDPALGKRKLENPGENARFPSIGVTGFEPAASASRTQRSTRLSHTPVGNFAINALISSACQQLIVIAAVDANSQSVTD